jgi:hypothetical protein
MSTSGPAAAILNLLIPLTQADILIGITELPVLLEKNVISDCTQNGLKIKFDVSRGIGTAG